MKITEILKLPTNELTLVLEGLVADYYITKREIQSTVDPDRRKLGTLNRKLIKITLELKNRGWEAIEYEGYVKYKPLSNSKKQDKLI